MQRELSYLDYVSDTQHVGQYRRYQDKYSSTIRESDKRLISIISSVVDTGLQHKQHVSLLDIGCSTGNLLLHLKHTLPDLSLAGADIVSDVVRECRVNTELSGITFSEMDILSLGHDKYYDIVVTNAALMFFSPPQFSQAVENVSKLLNPGGWFIAFDYFHPFEQELSVVETSQAFPNGLHFYMRSFSAVQTVLMVASFKDLSFEPFSIPIDLDRPANRDDISTYTVRTDREERLSFRGTLFQPWCYLTARKCR